MSDDNIFYCNDLEYLRDGQKSKKGKSKEYLGLVARLPCIVSGRFGPQVHHPRYKQGMSMRAPDWWCYPLHFDFHQGEHGIHTLGTKKWQSIYGYEREFIIQTQEKLKNHIDIPEEYLIKGE